MVNKTLKNGKNPIAFTTLVPQMYRSDNRGVEICYPAIVEIFPNDWAKVIPVTGNRNIVPLSVNQMMTSVVDNGVITREIILVRVKKVIYCADAQHLAAGLVERNMVLRCKLFDLSDMENAVKLMTSLNSTSRNWTVDTFVNCYAHFNQEYVKLIDMKNNSMLTMQVLAAICMNVSTATAKKAIENGTFQIVDEENANRKIKNINNMYAVSTLKPSSYATQGIIAYMEKIGVDIYEKEETKFLSALKKAVIERGYNKTSIGDKVGNLQLFNDVRPKSKK